MSPDLVRLGLGFLAGLLVGVLATDRAKRQPTPRLAWLLLGVAVGLIAAKVWP